AATHGDVRSGVEQLLGDRAATTVLLRRLRAGLGRLHGAVAGAEADVADLHRRRRVLDLGGGDVTRGEARALGQLEQRRVRLARAVDGDRVVVALGAGRPR